MFQARINVSRETIGRLKIYHDLLQKWNPVINLVSRSTIKGIWHRHFLDSAQLWELRPQNATTWLDLGSGAGFPGLVIAVLAKGEESSLTMSLVESDARKSAFLLNASQIVDTPVIIYTKRAEDLESEPFDVISARAFAPLVSIFEYSERFLKENTVLLLPKGKNHELELTEARKYWTFELQKTQSVTDPDGVILKIEGLGRA
ncbi:MAG: 16S rRNA (guanine(527)-N(7))-methyltransferase RsmG [Alphaproteobacteria bacterium]|nr:16S rRNA (guanine(527)-N(7))-methyltransferase RsmG [Alphaproteobacteria bacterium]